MTKGSQKLLSLAEKFCAEDGPACVFMRKGGKTKNYLFRYIYISGKRFLLITDKCRFPIALINVR